MPGCGHSSDPPADFRIRDYVACLTGFIAGLGLEQTHVLGLSFGTGLALELYRAHPELVRSLVLISAYAGWAGSLSQEVAAQRKQRMLQMIELPPQAWAREWLPTLLTDSAPPETVEELKTILADFHPGGQRTLLDSGFAEHDLRDLLPRFKGADSPVVWREGRTFAVECGRGNARQHSGIATGDHSCGRSHGGHAAAGAHERRGPAFFPLHSLLT
jgi:pimeloyl-ACP methyl ester carboxylesterase